jgi:RHS repeat-associated protein
MLVNGWSVSPVGNLCFQYGYDYRNRVNFKKTPDASPQYLVFNQKDLPVLTQDGNLRSSSEWAVIKYDTLNRITQTGFYSVDTAYSLYQMQGLLNSNQLYPSSFTVNTQLFYDGYSQVSGIAQYTGLDANKLISYSNSYSDPVEVSNLVRGLPTIAQNRIIEGAGNTWLNTVNYYDEKGRIIQIISDNISGVRDTVTNLFDFGGKILSSYTRHNNGQSKLNPRTTALSATVYDHRGRPVKNELLLNDTGSVHTIDSLSYDEIGKMSQKVLGMSIESLVYNYNIRGWLSGINQSYLNGNSNHYFGTELNYDFGFASPQYNGNISGLKWRSTDTSINRAYGFLYDNENRLIAANFMDNSSGGGSNYAADAKVDFSVPEISYDQNGNILTMNQKGVEVNASAFIDELTYAYTFNGNQLKSVSDLAPVDSSYHLGDFQDKNTVGNDYKYDANGNLGMDMNKGIDSIRYNSLNLPEFIHMTGKGSINYVYDGSGKKLQKIVTDSTNGGQMDTTTYIGPFVYASDTLQFMSDIDGRVRYVNRISQVSGAYLVGMKYDYFIKDQLGDTRIVLTEERDTTIYAATMEPAYASVEDSTFNNVNTTQSPTPTGFEPSSGGDTSNHYVSKLFGGTGGNRIGPAIVLKVMARDTISASVQAWYQGAVQPPPSGETPIINDLLSSLTNDVVSNNVSEFAGAMSPVSSALSLAMGSFVTNNETTNYVTNAPKAFLNWVEFDDQLNYINGGVVQVPQISAGQNKQVLQASLPMAMPKNGYIYIYLSNESQDTVYFNNLNINYRRGPVTEEEHYYPFGLTMAGISDRAMQFGKINRYRFNSSSEQQINEFLDGSGLGTYEMPYRSFDPQIGRFTQLDPLSDICEDGSPYAFVSNNPISRNDPSGMGDTIQLKEVIVKGTHKLKGGEYDGIDFKDIKPINVTGPGYAFFRGARAYSTTQIMNQLMSDSSLLANIGGKVAALGTLIGGSDLLELKSLAEDKELLENLKLLATGKLKLGPAFFIAAIGSALVMKGGDMKDQANQLHTIIENYISVNSALYNPVNQAAQGVFVISTVSIGAGGMSVGVTSNTSFYDIGTGQFLGEIKDIQ